MTNEGIPAVISFPVGTWGLSSRDAKRLFIVALAALAARGESGSNDPEKCQQMAARFGAGGDFDYFLMQRTDPGTLVKNMNDDWLIKSIMDAQEFGDPLTGRLREEAERRNLKNIPEITVKANKRKFSFDD